MVDGVHLTLLIGPMVPVPVSKVVLEALSSVEVRTSTAGPSVFELRFRLSNRSPLHTLFMLQAGAAPPIVRVIVIVTIRGIPQVISDGVMTEHSVSPGSGPGESTVSVIGEDLTHLMDFQEFTGLPYPAMPAPARIALILAKYAPFGVIPMPIPPSLMDVPIPVDRIPAQEGTDLEYIERLGREVGHVFYVDPGPVPGTNIAYWGPEVRIGVPQPALNLDMDAHTNVESLSFTFGSESRALPIVFIQNMQTRAPIPIPVPDISPLKPPLGLVPPLPKAIEFLEGTAKLQPVAAGAVALAKASSSADSVKGNGTLDVLRYGRPLKARQLVGVRGAGAAFDGLHYVTSVTHNIERGKYTQSFELARDGLLSTLPVVPP